MSQIIHDISSPNNGLGDPLRVAFDNQNEMNTELYNGKVDKVTGKTLSDNNFSDADKAKLDGIVDSDQIQSDWLQEDDTEPDFIKNKPDYLLYPDADLSTVSVGGIPTDFNLQGKSFSDLFKKMLVVFQVPTFASFTMAQSQLIEVGVALSGNKTFNWATTNPKNIVANSLIVTDATSNTVIGSGLANDGVEVLDIGTITNTSPITRNWNIKGTDLESNIFTSNNFTVNSIYPIFFYVSNTPPVANQALIDSGIKQVVQSDGTLNITFGAVGQYLWFAHPASMPTKTKWYVNALNNGNIGTISDLFNAPTNVNVTTVLWNGIAYKVYISNTPTTTVGNMELKNS